ncbi:unnamed protein product [Ascophyllum nodosum]
MIIRSSSEGVCRIARCPLLLLCIALVYMAILALRHENGPVVLGSRTYEVDEDENGKLTAVEEWGQSDSDRGFRMSLGGTGRGPLKGGVEVYPLQPARRPRKTRVPLEPEVAVIEGVATAWKMPRQYHQDGGGAMKGLYVMFHGCNHNHMDWFNLPEERTIVDYLVRMGYAVIAPDSKDSLTKCWNINMEGGDVAPVKAMLWKWYRDWSIPPQTPLFLLGASSGGVMATFMGSKGGFQLCDKRTTYVQVSGVLSQVSWGIKPDMYGSDCPPIAFMPMPKGELDAPNDPADKAPNVFGNSRKIPPRITAIAHHVRKAGGKPRMLLLPLGALSIYRAFFSDRVHEISEEQSARLHAALVEASVMECDPTHIVDGEEECFLSIDPRSSPLVLETLVDTYLFTPPGPSGTFSKEEASQPDVDVKMDMEKLKDYYPREIYMTEEHATEVFRELLNVAWGEHELSADFVALWESWLWKSCGYQCMPGA